MNHDFDSRLTSRALILGMLVGILCLIIGNLVFANQSKLSVISLKNGEIHPLSENKAQNKKQQTPIPKESAKKIIQTNRKESQKTPKTPKEPSKKTLKKNQKEYPTELIKKNSKESPNELIKKNSKEISTDHEPTPCALNKPFEILSFDFQRGGLGEGRLVFQLSNPSASVNLWQDCDKLIVHFMDACIPDRLMRSFDVKEFGTPLKTFTLNRKGNGVIVEMTAESNFEKMAYQTDHQFVIEVRGMSREERLTQKEGQFSGEKISFNFQDIEVRAALQILADFAGFNLITSDCVTGNITLRLQDVPWEQALNIILTSKGLAKRQLGTVVLVGPRAEIEQQELSELESLHRVSALEPLKTEYIQVNYAKAEKIAALLKEKQNSLLSSRGNVTYDERTNILLIQDVYSKIDEIKALMKRLDSPVRQVEISTQIVEANDSMEEILGTRFGGAAYGRLGKRRIGIGRTAERARAIADFPGNRVPPSNAMIPNGLLNAPANAGPTLQTTESLFSDLGFVADNTVSQIGRIGFALARLPNGTLIDLEIQALELESKVKTISRPKLMTTDKTKASVEQGFDIPYQEATSSGATSTSFRKAVLKLEVTPQITPDDKVILDLVINNDTPDTVNTFEQGGSFSSTIKTSRLSTQVLAENGETIVLGGVLTLNDTRTRSKIPFFGDLPFIGAMFRNKDIQQSRSEVLIFITPRIMLPGEYSV